MRPGFTRGVIALAFLLTAAASAARAETGPFPEGYSERWQRLVDGWIWRPGDPKESPLRGKNAGDGTVELVPGAWWFAEARKFESFRVVPADDAQPAGSALEMYAVTRGSMDVGPRADHLGMPPPRAALLAERMPWRERSGEARAELAPGQDADWVAVRCVAKNVALYRFALDGYERVTADESWERLERRVRQAETPGEKWPAPVDPETLPGHAVGLFLRSHRVLLPWRPEEDSDRERQLRGVAWCASDLQARVPVWQHARTRDWHGEDLPQFKDHLDRPCMRSALRERDVEGPCVLRVVARSTVLVKTGDELGSLDVTVSIGDASWPLRGWPGPDVDETSRLWDSDDFLAGDAPPERWLLSSPRELRLNVPPGTWKVRISSRLPVYSAIQELRSIGQREHRSPFRSLPRFEADSSRAREADAVALDLLGKWQDAQAALAGVDLESAPDAERGWVLWKRLALALQTGDMSSADDVAPRLVRMMTDLRGDLAAEARMALLRYAFDTRRDGMAAQIAQWIYDDPPAEPEDFVAALAAWCIGRRPLERMRAWPLSARPEVLRRFMRNIEARSVREIFGTWAELGTIGSTVGGRRWIIPVTAQVADRPLRGDAFSALLNVRSASGAGPWYISRAEDFRGVTAGEGYLQVLPAADWLPPVSVDVGRAGGASLGRLRFRDARNIGLLSLTDVAAGESITADPLEHPDRVFLWRGSNVVFGAASRDRRLNARFSDVPEAVRRTGDVTERWGILTDLSPLQGPPGSIPSVDFRGEDYTRAGLIRYRFAVASSDRMPADMDVPFTIYVGAEELPLRRLLWIARVEGESGDRESAPGPPVETYAPGPVVSGIVLVGPGPALVRIESPRPWESYGSISELDVAATPAELLIRRAESSNRLAPPSQLWDPPQGLTGDPKEASDTAAATRAIAEAPDAAARAVALEARARLMFRLGRNQCVPDLQQAELLFPEGSLDRDRVSMTLAVVAFRSGDDLELRARVESIIRAGSRSRELFLLAAAASLGTDDLASARVWLHQARLEPEDASGDLERFVAVALNEAAPAGEAVDPLMGILTDLLRLRRLDPVTGVAPALEKIAARCEGEALLAAGRDLFGRGARFADWAREARLLLPYAGKSDWPPPRGMLAPLERARDLRSEEVLATPPLVRLSGRYGAWESVWMTEGAELSLSLPGPEVYEFQWRSAHAVDHGVAQRTAAPARIVVDGLPGIGTHDVLGSEPAESVLCERLPWAAPGIVDSWRALAPAGVSLVRVRVVEGAGFLSVRRVAGPVWMAWDARAGNAAAELPFPPPLSYPAFAPDPKAEFIADVRRRLDSSRKAGPASRLDRSEDTEALTSLADDLLYAVFARRPGAQPEWVVRALDLYMKAHADGLGNAHWKANYGLARGLTRWTTVDLSADLPEFRRVRISQDLPDEPSVAVANALFFPFADEDATVLFNNQDSIEWHHRAAAEMPLHLEIVASADPPSDAPIFFELERDGEAVSSGPLEAGKRQMLAAGAAKEALVGVRVFSTRPLVRVRARARLMVETAEGLRPVNPERTGILYRAAAGKREFEVRGPTLARLERWDPTDLKATDDPAQWIADPAPIGRTLVQGVSRAGAATAEFDIPHEAFLRLSVRTVDGAALAALVPPDRPRGELAGEAIAPPAPDLIPEPAPGRRDQWRLVEYPGMVETYALAAWRDRGSQDFKESPDRSDVEVGARLHWKPFETSMYLRLDAFLTKESAVSPVHGGRIRFHHYFVDVPDLDYLISVDYAGQALGSGYYGYSWEEDVRLRWRLVLDEQWIFYAAAHANYWWSSLGDESFVSRAIHPLIHTDYRDDHYRWFQFEARLRAIPWQNVNVDMFATSRTEPTMIPWDTDRYHYGVIASAHYEDCFVELEADRVYRRDDAHRSRRSSERSLAIRTAYERWLRPGVWMSAQAGFRWSPDTHEREANFALTFRFGGHSGDGLNHVDPEHIRFLNYQQSRAPWRP